MFDRPAFADYLADYMRQFADVIWPEEKYKWQAVQHFQEHWDMNARDFAGMLRSALASAGKLFVSAQHSSKGMIEISASVDPEAVRAMFVEICLMKQQISTRGLTVSKGRRGLKFHVKREDCIFKMRTPSRLTCGFITLTNITSTKAVDPGQRACPTVNCVT